MSVETVNSVKNVQLLKIQEQKPAFGQNVPQKHDSEDKTGLIMAGLAAAAAIGAATIMIIKGKGNKVVKEATQTSSIKPTNAVSETISSAHSKMEDQVQALSKKEKIEEFAKKYRIKNYVTSEDLSKINGVVYKDGKPYTGKYIELHSFDTLIVYRYKNGKAEFKAEIFKVLDGSIESIFEREVNGVGSYRSSDYRGSHKLADVIPEEKFLKAPSIGELSQHSYKDITDIGVVSRGYNKDFNFYKASANAINPRLVYKGINYHEMSDASKIILAIGKSEEGNPVVFFQAPAGRFDNVHRPIRNMVTLTSKDGKFNEVQLDLIKAVVGKDFNELNEQKPLARAFSVNYSEIDETINIDENMFLNEIAHFSKGRELDSAIQKQLSELENMPNGTFKRLWEIDKK